jgi:HK97 family phage major capsid protein
MVLSRQALVQATPELDQAISRHLVGALLELLEYGAINGDGTSDAPVGIRSTAGVGAVVGGTDGAQIDITHLADLENAPEAANVPPTENAGFLVNAATKRWLRTKAAGTNLPYLWQGGERPLLGHRAGVTNNLPSNLSKGASGAVCSTLLYSADWSQLFLALYGGGIDLTVDRVTMASAGQIRIVAALHAGVGALVPAAFAKMDDGKTA